MEKDIRLAKQIIFMTNAKCTMPKITGWVLEGTAGECTWYFWS